MIETQQQSYLKQRIRQLKHYVSELHSCLETTLSCQSHRDQGLDRPRVQESKQEPRQRESAAQARMREQIVRLREQVGHKTKLISGRQGTTQRVLKFVQGPIPCRIKYFRSRFAIREGLHTAVDLLAEQQWRNGGIYMGAMCLVLVCSESLRTCSIKFSSLCRQPAECFQKYIKFGLDGPEPMNFIFEFQNAEQAILWFRFINVLSRTDIDAKNLLEKWDFSRQVSRSPLLYVSSISPTNLHSPIKNFSKTDIHEKPQNYEKPSDGLIKENNITLSLHASNQSNFVKQSNKNLSFVLPTQNDKNYVKNGPTAQIKLQTCSGSILFEGNQEKITTQIRRESRILEPKQQKQPLSPTKRQLYKLLPEKVLQKLQQKNRLLIQNNHSKLQVHWNFTQSENTFVPDLKSEKIKHNQTSVVEQIKLFNRGPPEIPADEISFSKHEVSKKNSSTSPTRDRNTESQTRIKSNSKGEESVGADALRVRKRTDLSLQNDKHERKKDRDEVRDKYLYRLMQKQMSLNKSSSRQEDSGRKKITSGLLPISEKKTPTASRRQSGRGQFNQIELISQSSRNSDEQSDSSADSTEQQIQIQQLKNGIVLQKCSKDAWSAKEKRLFLSNTMGELCYCDLSNPMEEKRFFLRDITGFEYGKYSVGILKHKKKKIEENRCLKVTVRHKNKEKVLEFYLDAAEPAYNLQEYCRKFLDFLQQQIQKQEMNSPTKLSRKMTAE